MNHEKQILIVASDQWDTTLASSEFHCVRRIIFLQQNLLESVEPETKSVRYTIHPMYITAGRYPSPIPGP